MFFPLVFLKKRARSFGLLFLALAGMPILLSAGPMRVLLITGGNPSAEENAWLAYAARQDWKITARTWEELAERKTFPKGIDIIWVHQTDTTFSAASRAAGARLAPYIQQGGKLLLTMEAARYLNQWGFEPNPLQTRTDTVRDEGFGRPLGFHAFKEHPLFAGMHGGAYPSKQKKDHLARKTGFFDNALPGNPQAKVIGIEWTYITFHESSKLVLEYPVGKGKVLSAGAFIGFAPDNYNRSELERFCRNSVEWLAHGLEGKGFYWDYAPAVVSQAPLPHPASPMPPSKAWALPPLSISLTAKRGDDSFLDLAGRRILLMGKEKGGIDEIWTHPFMTARDLQTGILWGDSLFWLHQIPCRVTISPELILREYSLPEGILKEILTVSFDQPLALVHYEFPESAQFKGFVVQAVFNSRLMWPYDVSATQSMAFDYDPASQTLTASAQNGALAALMGFSQTPDAVLAGQFGSFAWKGGQHFQTETTSNLQVGALFTFDPPPTRSFNYAIAGSSEGMDSLLQVFQRLQPELDRLYLPTGRYYRDLLSDKLQIETPDSVFNQGFRWAMARTDQMFQTTPGLGTTHMAGFGTTARGWNGSQAVSGRPGYAWYFGRDGEWSGMAVNAYGDFSWVKEMLKVFARYQNLDGKIYHELTSSGAVHYDASDATPLYVVLAAHYLRYSGDLDFIRSLWPSLEKALQFCYATDTDGDGLIENTNVGHGWIEGGALFGTHTEFYLAGVWAACLESGAYLAQHLNKTDWNKRLLADARKVKSLIDQDFWNAGGDYFFNGKMKDGSYMNDATVLQAVPVYLQAVEDDQKARQSVQPFSGAAMSPDWGIRMIPDTNPKFNPRSYHAGMVWPLYGGWASLAEYRTGYFNSGFFHLFANLMNFRFWGKGSVEETLHGTEFRPAGVCSQQCWSETMVLLPAIEGMLGLQVDAPAGALTLAPRFPWDWNEVAVRNIRTGAHKIHFTWKKTPQQTHIQITNEGVESKPVSLSLQPAFPFGTEIGAITIDGKPAKSTALYGPEAMELVLEKTPLPAGKTMDIVISHQGGLGALPLCYIPEPNSASQGARIIGQQWEGGALGITYEGVAGRTYTAKVWSELPLKQAKNAEILRQEGAVAEIRFQCPETQTPYSRITVELEH